MIFYFSGTTSGADPEKELGEQATIMLSFYLAVDKAPKGALRQRRTLKPDERFQLVFDARRKAKDNDGRK